MRRALPAVVGAVMVIAGIAVASVSLRTSNPTATLLGGNLPVDPTALSRNDATSNNSPTVVSNPRNPANLVEVNRIDAPQFTCALNVSFDGGSTWAATRFPTPPGENASCLAPDAAFGVDGTLYVSLTSYAILPVSGLDPAAIFVVSSTDGGRTLSAPRKAEGPFGFGVRIVADPSVARRVHLTWVQATASNGAGFATDDDPVMTARSDDGAVTWRTPVQLSGHNRQRVLAPTPVAAGKDDLYVAYLDVLGDRLDYNGAHQGMGGEPYRGPWSLIVARSRDGGSSWHESVAEAHLTPTRRFVDLFAPTPSIAVDHASGFAYVAFSDGRLGDPDVFVWSSSDGGGSWGAAVRVNDTPPHDGRSQYLPALQTAPDGRLDVAYYDRRRDRTDTFNEVSLQSSFDHGRTFTGRLVLSEAAFDSGIGFGLDRGLPELGSRLSMLSTDGRALALWCDTRAGVRVTKKQDIAEAVAGFSDSFAARLPLRFGGLGLAAIGLVAMLSTLLGRRRHQIPGPPPA